MSGSEQTTSDWHAATTTRTSPSIKAESSITTRTSPSYSTGSRTTIRKIEWSLSKFPVGNGNGYCESARYSDFEDHGRNAFMFAYCNSVNRDLL